MHNSLALCASMVIEANAGDAPEWIHLLPAGTATTNDGRGPYRIADASGVIANSLPGHGERLVLCENHATDLAAPKGAASPARGWIIDLESRADGIWGKVEWTAEGRRMVASREYRGISPVIRHREDGSVVAIRRATLTNAPNLQGLQTLHSQENDMNFRTAVIQALNLSSYADDAEILSAIRALRKEKIEALQAERPEHTAVLLARKATAYQNKMEDAGITISYAAAVQAIVAGTQEMCA